MERHDLALLPSDHKLRSHLTERYGKNAIPAEMTIEDLPVSYDELEPYYDKFEKLCGVSGKAGNLRGKIIDGGNVFEGPRQNEYPNPPLARSMAGTIMDEAARSLGYHPFPAPSSNASEAYTNSEGLTLGACEYCGHCERFGCEANAKASPNVCILPALLADPKFELRTHAQVKELVYDKAARKVTAVRYVDTPQRRGIRAAGRHRHSRRLCVQQRAADAHGRHRRALRSTRPAKARSARTIATRSAAAT